MRDTSYGRELATASLPSGDSEVRIERLFVKEPRQEEIRFSWWKSDKMMMRPLDLPEDELLELFRLAVAKQVFTPGFLRGLKAILP
jgi:hypothetical protein